MKAVKRGKIETGRELNANLNQLPPFFKNKTATMASFSSTERWRSHPKTATKGKIYNDFNGGNAAFAGALMSSSQKNLESSRFLSEGELASREG